jgi:hypothetical protein
MPHPEFLPQRCSDLVVLSKVLSERRQSRLVSEPRRRGRKRSSFPLLLRRSNEVRFAVKAGLARDARSDGDVVDREVHLSVGRAHVDLLDARAEECVGVDGEGEVVNESDGLVGRGGRGEEGDGTGEGLRGGKDVGVDDPEEVVASFSIRADKVVDFRVDADDFLTCGKGRQLRRECQSEGEYAPTINLLCTLGYFALNSSTIRIAASPSSATEKMISKFG